MDANLKAKGSDKSRITFPMTLNDHKLKELVWKLDREIWAHVPNPLSPEDERAWSQSKAREESAKWIAEYFINYSAEKYLAKIKEVCETVNGNLLQMPAAIQAIRALINEFEKPI